MYILAYIMYIIREVNKFMPSSSTQLKHKHFILNHDKIKQAQKLLGAQTETETIERALEELISERERDARALQAHERFMKAAIKGKITIRDVYGVLED